MFDDSKFTNNERFGLGQINRALFLLAAEQAKNAHLSTSGM